MKILYDHQIFELQKYGGISRIFAELILDEQMSQEVEICQFFGENEYAKDSGNISQRMFPIALNFFGKNRLKGVFNRNYASRILKEGNFDIFHPTYYNPYFLKYLEGRPFVLTVFDMIHELFPELFPSKDNTAKNKKKLALLASKIIAISQNTKNDLVKIYGIEESKIEVIHLGNSMDVQLEPESNIKTPKKYILFVGKRKGYKNFIGLINSIRDLMKEDEELSVICAGGGNFNKEEQQLLENYGLKNRVSQLDVNDKQLQTLYKNAICYVFPSLYEGFGIPVLEAFACRCPLVCSNLSSLPEIAGKGAEYFDPYDKISMYNAIYNVLNNEYRRKELIEFGIERLRDFSWERTAKETRKVYESLL